MKNFYAKVVDALVDDGYIIIEDALSPTLSSQLLQKAKLIHDYKHAGISNTQSRHLDTKRRRDKIYWLDEDGGCVSKFLDFTTNLQEALNRSLFLGLRYYEAHFAKYEAGDFYEKHLDAFKNSKNRVVTTVYYLNESWSDADGGALVIYDANGEKITTVLPKQNTLVVFLSDKFPHEVEPANKTRYSIAGWFRVDKGVFLEKR